MDTQPLPTHVTVVSSSDIFIDSSMFGGYKKQDHAVAGSRARAWRE